MTIKPLKTAMTHQNGTPPEVTATVAAMLARIKTGGEDAVRHYAATLDRWQGDIVVPDEMLRTAGTRVAPELRAAIHFAHENIHHFATAQRGSIQEFETEIRPGLFAGQKLIPVSTAGCYVPGGRYAHIASALMTITTARVAGVRHITVASPPRGDAIPDAILFAMHLAGATRVLNLGGVQAIAAMAQGLFETPGADILVGPGNAFVAEAKRQMFGPVGIDMFAGPTDSLVIADGDADPETVAWDLVGQAEHGANSPIWLASLSLEVAEQVIAIVPRLIASLPEPNRAAADRAWRDLGEVVVCDSRDEAADYADARAPEHLHVQAGDLDYWRNRLRSYGALFLGAQTTVAFGDKATGPNHVLPTSGAARYTGGLSVHKFLKCVTWQEMRGGACPDLADACATISRAEGMEGHARTADIRQDSWKQTGNRAAG